MAENGNICSLLAARPIAKLASPAEDREVDRGECCLGRMVRLESAYILPWASAEGE